VNTHNGPIETAVNKARKPFLNASFVESLLLRALLGGVLLGVFFGRSPSRTNKKIYFFTAPADGTPLITEHEPG
jgi:hypothetical protein